MTNADGQEFIGRAQRAQGKATTIQLQQRNLSGTIERVRIVGREELTGSERARNEFILLVLRGERTLDESHFVRLLWFPLIPTHLPKASKIVASPHLMTKTLNQSQRSVVEAMITDQIPLVIAHGKLIIHNTGKLES